MSASPPPRASASPYPAPPPIDRQTTVPFLLNFCYRSSAFHSLAEFPLPTPSNPKPRLAPAHVEIYTWMNCTLRELAQLLTSALPGVVPVPSIGTRLAFRLVYPDLSSGAGRGGGGRNGNDGRLLNGDEGRGRYVSREMGSVVIAAPVGEDGEGRDGAGGAGGAGGGGAYELGGEDAEKTLEDARFVIGDYVDVAVFPPLSDGSVVSRGAAMGGGGSGGGGYRGRENGYPPRGGRGGAGGFGGGRGRGGGDFGPPIPAGEWRRGERLPDAAYRGRGRGRY